MSPYMLLSTSWEKILNIKTILIFGDHFLHPLDLIVCIIMYGCDEEQLDAYHCWSLKG